MSLSSRHNGAASNRRRAGLSELLYTCSAMQAGVSVSMRADLDYRTQL